VDSKASFVDRNIRPDALHQITLADNFSGALDQNG
jgi:hypothetical protein